MRFVLQQYRASWLVLRRYGVALVGRTYPGMGQTGKLGKMGFGSILAALLR